MATGTQAVEATYKLPTLLTPANNTALPVGPHLSVRSKYTLGYGINGQKYKI
jgi:hypothetical protein